MNASDLITYMWCTTSVPFTSLVCSIGCHTLELGAVVDARDWSDGSGSKQKSQPVERGQNIIANRVGVTSFAGKYLNKYIMYVSQKCTCTCIQSCKKRFRVHLSLTASSERRTSEALRLCCWDNRKLRHKLATFPRKPVHSPTDHCFRFRAGSKRSNLQHTAYIHYNSACEYGLYT